MADILAQYSINRNLVDIEERKLPYPEVVEDYVEMPRVSVDE